MEVNINLLPWRKTRYQRRLTSFYSASICLLFLIGTIFWLAHHWIMSSNQQRRLNNTRTIAKITALQAQLKSMHYLNNTKKRITLLTHITQQNQQRFNNLMEITQALPTNAYLTRLEIHPPAVIFQGHANNALTVATFINNLNHINTLKKITLSKIIQQNDSVYSIQAQLHTIKPS